MLRSALVFITLLAPGIWDIMVVGSLNQISEDNEYLMEVGSSVNVPCNTQNIPAGVNVWTVEWRKRTYFSDVSETVYTYNSSSTVNSALNSWSKRDIKLNTSIQVNSIYIPIVHTNDSGFYDCLLTVDNGQIKATAVHLNVFDKNNDNILSHYGNGFLRVVEVGYPTSLPCDTFLKPELVIQHVQWIKRAESNNLTEVVYNFSGNVNRALNSWTNKNISLNNSLPTLVINIPKIMWTDNGLLDCRVTYRTGAVKTSTVRLKVFGQGWISITCIPEKSAISLHDSMSCLCAAERIDPAPLQGFSFLPKDSTGLQIHHGLPKNTTDSLTLNITWERPRTEDIVLECSLAVTETNDTYQGNMTAIYIIKVNSWTSGLDRPKMTTFSTIALYWIVFVMYTIL